MISDTALTVSTVSDTIHLIAGTTGDITIRSTMTHSSMIRTVTTTGTRRVGVGALDGDTDILTGVIPGIGEDIGARLMPGDTRDGVAIIRHTRFTTTEAV